MSCSGGESLTRQLKGAVETAKRDVEAAKENKEKADRKRSQSGLSDDDKRAGESEYKKASDDLDAANNRLEQAAKDLEAGGKLVKEAIYRVLDLAGNVEEWTAPARRPRRARRFS